MELRHLRHFVAVAEELHFARAAERLGIEQSPLSHSIRNLEGELGVCLFQRTTRRTWLTRAGSRFYTEALRVLEAVEEAKAVARNASAERPIKLSVGLAEHAAGELFTRFLFELQHRTSTGSVDLREIAPGEAVRLLKERLLDLVILLQPVEGNGLLRRRAWSERLAVVAPIGHALAERKSVSLHELVTEPFVLASATASPGYAAQVEEVLTRHDVRPEKRLTVKHQNTMVIFAATGRGLALLPESIAHGLTTVAIVPLTEHDAEITSWFVYREEDASDGVSIALEVGSVIDGGGNLFSDAGRSG